MFITIGNKRIGPNERTFVIAEIGINHNGDIKIAKKLIDAAYDAGADAVKFQKRTIPVIYSKKELEKPREVPRNILELAIERGVLSAEAVARLQTSDFQESTNGDQKWALEFTKGEYREIDKYCEKKGILWFASPWDEESVDFLEQFNPVCYKIASASLTDDNLLKHIRSKGKPIILSTGMSDLSMVKSAVCTLGNKDLIILHCTSTYPAEPEELHLRGIHTLQSEFPNNPIGYSGHEIGLVSTVCAVALGACVIERHVTLGRAMYGSDQSASVEPTGMQRLIKDIRVAEKVSGSEKIHITDSERPIMEKLRKK